MNERIVGIDLGTTNSEVAVWAAEGVRVLEEDGSGILPSVVGLSPEGRLLVGEEAQNQLVLHPGRTVRSVKRLMGTAERLRLGDREFSPQEISAMILSALRDRAERILGGEVSGAVVTVPAWFTDAQRQATREAGEIAGLKILRILNEPTAASLAHGDEKGGGRTFLVYDLGGGTFDVSVVRIEEGVNEVLASHGDTRLGGDDLDEILLEKLLDRLDSRLSRAAREEPRVRARLLRAAESARRRLSEAPYARIREESLLLEDDVPVHVEAEISREDLEDWTRPLLEKTLKSVHFALGAAGVASRDLDGVLLAGGVTRMPLVSDLLEEATGHRPRRELHPDLCVALGAGLLAARLSGKEESRVLVDITPYSFGPIHAEIVGEVLHGDRYTPLIRRGTPLPARAEHSYYTVRDEQEVAEIKVQQGENRDARLNVDIGSFLVEGLAKVPEGNEILIRLDLDVSGMLHVTATERATGLSRSVRIEGAVGRMGERELARARERVADLTGHALVTAEAPPAAMKGIPKRAREVVERYFRGRERLHEEDRAEGDALVERLRSAGAGKGSKRVVREALGEIEDLLFYAGEGDG